MRYKVWPTGKLMDIKSLKDYTLPFAGARILVKARPNVAKEVSTD